MIRRKLTILISIFGLLLPSSYVFAGTVLSSYKYAWSNNVGYINFENVTIEDSALSGYAWSANAGWINFNPNQQGGVLNDGTGNLSGSAWGERLGWIDFDNVLINPTTGKFSGTAIGVLAGTITFDCPNYCDVRTDWAQASVPALIVVSSGGGGSSGGGTILFNGSTSTTSTPSPVPFLPNTALSNGTSSPSRNLFTEEPLPKIVSKPAAASVLSEIKPLLTLLQNQ